MSTDGTKSALAWLTAGTSAVVCLGFAQTAGGRYRRPPSKKPKATDLTTAVDHGNVFVKSYRVRCDMGVFIIAKVKGRKVQKC